MFGCNVPFNSWRSIYIRGKPIREKSAKLVSEDRERDAGLICKSVSHRPSRGQAKELIFLGRRFWLFTR